MTADDRFGESGDISQFQLTEALAKFIRAAGPAGSEDERDVDAWQRQCCRDVLCRCAQVWDGVLDLAAEAGLPISLTKPLGVGVLNNRHKTTGEVSPEAIASMTALNREASRAALEAGVRATTDVTGFGLLGHLFKMCRASGVAARIDAAAMPYIAGAREALAAGHVPGGSVRNLDWVRPHLSAAPRISEHELILLADAQTSGGLLVVGEVPGAPVIGETVAAGSRGTGVVLEVA